MAIYVEISKGRPVPTQVEDPPPTGNLPQGQAFSQHPSNATPHSISPDPYPLPKDDINTSPSVEKRLEAGLPRAPSVQRFHCGICLELHAIDEIVRVDLCEHAFCNKCMRSYISSKLKERSFPIFCPMCLTEKSAQDPSGGLTRSEHLGHDSFLPDTQILMSFWPDKLGSPRRSKRSGPTWKWQLSP